MNPRFNYLTLSPTGFAPLAALSPSRERGFETVHPMAFRTSGFPPLPLRERGRGRGGEGINKNDIV